MKSNKKPSKADANQPEIVAKFKELGATVQHLHDVRGGCPDLLVGYNGVNLLVEIKDENKPASQQKLNEKQQKWFMWWQGQAIVITSPEEAHELINQYTAASQ